MAKQIKKIKSAIQMLDERPINLKDLDDIIDDFEIANGPMPYAKKLPNGLWDIFNGENHVYCGDAGKKAIEDAIRKIGQKASQAFLEKHKNLK
jgi:hypothetical protein